MDIEKAKQTIREMLLHAETQLLDYEAMALQTVLNELDNKDDDIDILLNRIDEYKKNTMWKYEVKEALDKKDKIINEMAKWIEKHTGYAIDETLYKESKEYIIDFFTKEVIKED